jgi:hypothetical protein
MVEPVTATAPVHDVADLAQAPADSFVEPLAVEAQGITRKKGRACKANAPSEMATSDAPITNRKRRPPRNTKPKGPLDTENV